MARCARLFWAGLLLLPVRAAGAEAAGGEAVGGEAGAGEAGGVAASTPLETSVTIYRAPDDRFGAAATDGRDPPRWLQGYALISEVRDIDLPAGPAVIRFPGVAAGMLAESVIVSGLPVGVREKNVDALALSPRHLYAGWFGRPVTLRRHDPATGKTREERAVIRSAPDGAAIVETDHGFEAMTCGPFSDSIVYPDVPEGLFASPTLSIATDAPAPAHVRVRLAYLAWDYDWRADYVLKLAPDLRHATLSAWVTLASADVTSFPHTMAAVVAGKPHFSETRDRRDDDGDLTYQCFLRATPSPPMVAPPPPVMAMAVPAPMARAEIMVTAMRKAVVAEAEDLGDLKLYRLPLPTTVAARGQKQVALFEPRAIAVEVLHTAALDTLIGQGPARLMVRTRNRKAEGLGLALPGGRVRVLLDRGTGALVVGEGALDDRALGDRVDIGTAQTPQVTVRQVVTQRRKDGRMMAVTVSNANPFAIRFEGTFRQTPSAAIHDSSAPLGLQDGHRVWALAVPAHGRVTLHYRLTDD